MLVVSRRERKKGKEAYMHNVFGMHRMKQVLYCALHYGMIFLVYYVHILVRAFHSCRDPRLGIMSMGPTTKSLPHKPGRALCRGIR